MISHLFSVYFLWNKDCSHLEVDIDELLVCYTLSGLANFLPCAPLGLFRAMLHLAFHKDSNIAVHTVRHLDAKQV